MTWRSKATSRSSDERGAGGQGAAPSEREKVPSNLELFPAELLGGRTGHFGHARLEHDFPSMHLLLGKLLEQLYQHVGPDRSGGRVKEGGARVGGQMSQRKNKSGPRPAVRSHIEEFWRKINENYPENTGNRKGRS